MINRCRLVARTQRPAPNPYLLPKLQAEIPCDLADPLTARSYPLTANFGVERLSPCTCRRLHPRSLRKEVIQPQVLLRLPCYDFTPIMNHSLGRCLPCGLARRLLVQSTFVM